MLITSSFIDSLSAKVHPTPPTVDKLSGLFQDFYALAATHINTHIATLSSQQHRKNSSPAPSISSRSSVASNFRAKAASISSKDAPKPTIQRRDSEQQMLTAEEIAGRKRARRLLEHKKVALEEIVERRVCERIYDRIWRHRSTQDEAQDEKLRSKTAALAVVGIGLGDLGITLGKDASGKSGAEMEQEVRAWLEGARQELVLMNDRKYPLGKLQHLKAAHKGIVDTLSHFHPSSSADEIMPMLIYTLITSPAEGINVMSNLFFIQRFRDENKIDGEAAYCLTNLEAAITFLETVDLASLRADESPSGPPKSASRPTTPGTERSNPHDLAMTPSITAPSLSPAVIDPTTANTAVPQQGSSTSAQESLRPGVKTHKRRLSDLLQPPAQAFSTASDAMLSTADQSFKTINASLGNSYNFLLGKLKERQENITEGSANLVVPKTLDDARRLITTPPPEEDGSTASGASSIHTPEDKRVDDKVLSLLVGKRPAREQSVDSSRSAGSGRKVSFMENATPTASPLSTSTSGNNSSGTTALSSNPAMVIGENLRSLGNSLNPIGRFAGFGSGGMMKGFGRTTQAANDIATNAVSGGDGVPDHGVAELTAVSRASCLSFGSTLSPKCTASTSGTCWT